MHTGLVLPVFMPAENYENTTDSAVELAKEAQQLGVESVWFPQLFSHDAIGLASVVGRDVPGLKVGTSVVPMYPRHPMLLASSAKTAQAATHGRFQLGLGLGAPTLSDQIYGLPFPPVIQHLREYLTALRPLLDGEMSVFEGETLTSRPVAPTAVAGAQPTIPVLVAAMGQQALRVTGELADGTITAQAGPRVLETHIVPKIRAAAADAGRPAPRIVAQVGAAVTNKCDEARATLAPFLGFYEGVPSYRRVLELEGVSAADLVVLGDEDTVAAGIRRYIDAGATEIVVAFSDLLGEDVRQRTWRLVGELSRAGS